MARYQMNRKNQMNLKMNLMSLKNLTKTFDLDGSLKVHAKTETIHFLAVDLLLEEFDFLQLSVPN